MNMHRVLFLCTADMTRYTLDLLSDTFASYYPMRLTQRRPNVFCRLIRHVTTMQAVRAASDSRSLVLLDEVGTGTEPVEGSALGVALLETLVKGGRGGAGFTMATTHHR